MSRKRKTNNSRRSSNGSSKLSWYRVDLHLHTPASNDYEQPGTTYLEWLRQAALMDLDIVAVTDHNTVAGVAKIRREIEWLSRLEAEGRLNNEEQIQLDEWRRLANKVLVLPGFEFTATFGFHIIGLFPPETSVRELEHVLLSLNVPAHKLDEGSTETGASTDVLTAYEVIKEAGGIAIAAHANSTHGVAMRNFPFGGQTKIAYTQDDNLDALEVTDLESRSRRATARFFNGSKPEYPRKMHCLQGSDAHRLISDPKNPKRLGIGERASELLLPEASFEAIQELFESKYFDRIRTSRVKEQTVDHLEVALNEGANQVQSFHESASRRGGRQAAILADICAFANTDGGTVFVGASTRKGPPKGLSNPKQVQNELQQALNERLTPPIDVKFETIQSHGSNVLRVSVSEGEEKPYCIDGSKFYVRNDAETGLAVRDEIVALVLEAIGADETMIHDAVVANTASGASDPAKSQKERGKGGRSKNGAGKELSSDDPFYTPQMGVELVASEVRNGTRYYIVRDMRNGRTVSNVTRKGARKLWNYAIAQHEDHMPAENQIDWKKNVGMIKAEKRAGKVRYDLAMKEGKNLRIFYGVTEDGMEGPWAQFVGEAEAA